MHHQQWVCFKAEDSVGQTFYELIQVDLTQPTIAISQFQNQLEVRASVANDTEIIDSSWQNFITPSEAEPACSDDDFVTSDATEGTEIQIDKTDNNKWVCYQVLNSLGVPGYGKYQLDYNAPTITISFTENGTALLASSPSGDLPDAPQWKKSGPNSSSDCDSSTTFKDGNLIQNVVEKQLLLFQCCRPGWE